MDESILAKAISVRDYWWSKYTNSRKLKGETRREYSKRKRKYLFNKDAMLKQLDDIRGDIDA